MSELVASVFNITCTNLNAIQTPPPHSEIQLEVSESADVRKAKQRYPKHDINPYMLQSVCPFCVPCISASLFHLRALVRVYRYVSLNTF